MAAKLGPVLLALGVCWALFALAIPMFGLTTGKSLAILLGITLLLGALGEVVTMMASGRDWKPTHAALAVAMVAVGIVALAWPGPTLVVVARITAWALLAVGIHALLTAFSQRHAVHEGTWWVPLSVGAMSLGVAFWAAAHHHPTYSFAILWVALTALMIGLTKFAATLRSVGGEEPRLEALSGYTGRAAGAARSTAGRRDTATLTRGGV
ncbi:DUF308 domain-containing protein [Frankia sp. EI5c]|uniref:DUF308 domain-containing protein n=1 Tax=Frankia sp. EI5c TaxID=683316 RepID=UPI001F5BC50C|nr:DUF308 domain-containing protein [Frankia sp. EI5c]